MNIANLDQKAFEFLQSVSVESIQRRDYELITISPSETALNALKILERNKISSAPIFDEKRQVIVGTISVMDLVVWIVRTYSLSKGDKDPNYFDIGQLTMELNTPVREVINWGLDPFWPVPGADSVLNLINNFLSWRVHRVPVVGEDRHITGSISQSDIVRMLHGAQNVLEALMKKSVKELNLEEGGVVSVLDTEPLIKAFGAIAETQYTGLAVVNSHNKLVGNVSASDLKGLTLDNFHKLNVPIREFLANAKKVPIRVKGDALLSEVVAKLAENRIHRVYVVDEEDKLLNVISLTSIMKVFSTNSEDPFLGGRVNIKQGIAV